MNVWEHFWHEIVEFIRWTLKHKHPHKHRRIVRIQIIPHCIEQQ